MGERDSVNQLIYIKIVTEIREIVETLLFIHFLQNSTLRLFAGISIL